MRIPINSAEDIGTAIRTARKQQGLRQDDLAAVVGSSHVFLRDVESGKPTVQLGRVLRILQELGISLEMDFPDSPRKVRKGPSR
ncbi:transcriptional regulator [Pseudoxanthomonas sacheonensis]|nr:helix-turn-helix domain-containing protein [Pseudoxanthomonas sacheonensis]KAF1706972.1 transcriptional regulator [Pseudoxanthomonas sacheonensis]